MATQVEDKFMAMNVEAATRFRTFQPTAMTITKESSCRIFCRRFFICILLVAVVALSSIVYAVYSYASNLSDVCHTKECLRSAAAFKQNMNLQADPCEDFYSYVCGNWADDHPRPARHGAYSWYDERQTKIYRNIRIQLEANVTRSDPKPVAQAKSMYKACLSEANRERYGFTAVQSYLKEFGLPLTPTLLNRTKTSARKYKFDWISSVAKIQRKLGLNVIVGFNIEQDHQDKNRNRLTLEYHYRPDELRFPAYEWSKLKAKAHGRRPVAVRSSSQDTDESDNESAEEEEEKDGEDDEDEIDTTELAESFARVIEAINPSIDTSGMDEKMNVLAERFAEFHRSLPKPLNSEDESEPEYYTVKQLQNATDHHIKPKKSYPVWQRYLDVLFANQPDAKPSDDEQLQMTPENVEFLGKLIDVVSDQPPALIELYVWGTVASFLVDHEFNDATLEEECAQVVHKLMGLAVSYAIADKSFLERTKPRVEQMLTDIRDEFDQMVLETDWMDAYTKYASLEKSKAMKSLIGFPEWILDDQKLEEHYAGLEISPTRHLENWVTALEFMNTGWLRSWKVKNNEVWDMDPTEVNAYNIFDRNAINIPVAIIQYPFYYLGLDALNYGALGEVLGHELTHGFDNAGRHYDKFGNEKRWWSNHTLQEYDKRAQCLEEQYSSYYVPEAKAFINGTLTLGENIADNGGLREAFRAYRAYVKRNGPEPVLPGFENFSHEQLLFISFGNQYCESISPAVAKYLVEDEHSPSKYRVLGVLSNMPEFSEAFQCPSGSKMNPKKKCRVW
ncbi:endothelin-converting enzyme 1 [Aedes albopictus]|uniref:M13 family peptidase n=1 Tax=Aedes albopictus TaxID=7160 RepID=A0ABM1Y2P8_AEDAL|nr:endothelin-converting enzyme 1-like [Aedes albopictus]XP_029723128.1 endothelin-converting enzyme 1-like [Aedes albopictus]XP_029723129.1 endothelin-converting enzyme 1-like [Aedes albopictus]XP_029723130.1 endothelin-converting enzyme 1-like [Aedes albopictus]XP_029723131.1 endothelin-converting enzyme 1-like [Aedes albopictus]XP_029723132.1 endothelin-converting enzyme 1-like [Aedes albopictus]XP_029723133.1 endothelin-converting enzyme 1-like [Aedes albopictus]